MSDDPAIPARHPLKRVSILPADLENAHRGIFEEFGLPQDILRPTFISMFVGKFGSVGEAALQAGNSEDVIRRYYLDLKSPVEGERFFIIWPRQRPSGRDQCPCLLLM